MRITFLLGVCLSLILSGCDSIVPEIGGEGQPCSTEGTCKPGLECLEGVCCANLEWIQILGGTFMMGSPEEVGNFDEHPQHQVNVPSFKMLRTEVTVAQYQSCLNAGVCTEPDDFNVKPYCNWGQDGRDDHPVNCCDWDQASDFCSWACGRLPSEAEWEYAAISGWQDITYPWGDEAATCNYAIMNDGGLGCGLNRTWPVCSKPDGKTQYGLCDMAGNVLEWLQDWEHFDYNGAPSDGSAWESPIGSLRVVRGGSFIGEAYYLRAAKRIYGEPSGREYIVGLRCVR